VTDHDFAELLQLLYLLPNCSVGGPLHIVVDDLNTDDAALDFAQREAEGNQHWSYEGITKEDRILILETCTAILTALRAADEDERERLIRL
jgi:hypothetical protein